MKIKKNSDFIEGTIEKIQNIFPTYINNKNPKYIEIDDTYYSGILITNYYREQEELILKELINSNTNMRISIFYEKQDSYKTIKELTYYIGDVGEKIKEENKNSEDIEIAAFTYNDAKYIRKEMQVNNEDLYFLYIYISIFSESKKELEYELNKIEGILQSKNMQTRIAYYRQEQLFLSCLPFMINNKDVKQISKRNILTNGLISTYPFISSEIYDENGVFFGNNKISNSPIFIDKYNEKKYKNSNICIFGTSGGGKSFLCKTQVLRNRILGTDQFIIDPDREYNNLCKELEGELIKIGPNSNTYINIFDIRENSLEDSENGFLSTKIQKLITFFSLIFGDINEEEVALLEEKIIKCYKNKNITFDDKSLYEKEEEEKIQIKLKFKNTRQMPILEDLYKLLEKDKKAERFRIKLKPFVYGSLNYFNKYTNIKIENKLIVADIYEVGEENIKYAMFLFIELFWDKIKQDREKNKTIYLDEIWKLIGVTSNKNVASFIYKIFKSIRKYGGSSVAITQDISDLFSLENGTYGKSILNNSELKIFFYLEKENINILEKCVDLIEQEKIEIKNLKRGECLMYIRRKSCNSKNRSK